MDGLQARRGRHPGRVSRLVSGVGFLAVVVAGCGGGSSEPSQTGSSSAYSTPETYYEAIEIAHDVILTTRREVASEYPTTYRDMKKDVYVGCGGGGFDDTESRSSGSIHLDVPEGERIPLGKEVAEHWRARGFNLDGADDWQSRDEPGFAADVVPNVRASFEITTGGLVDIDGITDCLPKPEDGPDPTEGPLPTQTPTPIKEGSPPVGGR